MERQVIRLGVAWHRLARRGSQGLAWQVTLGTGWSGLVRPAEERRGAARNGRLGKARTGEAR